MASTGIFIFCDHEMLITSDWDSYQLRKQQVHQISLNHQPAPDKADWDWPQKKGAR